MRTKAELEEGRDATAVAATVKTRLSTLHSLVVGPGLGRDDTILESVTQIIGDAKDLSLPIVVDGDGLWLVCQEPGIIHGYRKAILTPNAAEYSRLCQKLLGAEVRPNSESVDQALLRTASLAAALGHVTILRKGEFDIVSDGLESAVCSAAGGLRRCSGQGDILAGTVGLFNAWTHSVKSDEPATLVAAIAGAALTRRCSQLAYQKHRRSVTTTRLLDHVGESFEALFE